jgi:hypothetical protein
MHGKGTSVETVDLDIALEAGLTAASAQIAPTSPLVLVALERHGTKRYVRIDLDKRIALDESELTPASIIQLVKELLPRRAALLNQVIPRTKSVGASNNPPLDGELVEPAVRMKAMKAMGLGELTYLKHGSLGGRRAMKRPDEVDPLSVSDLAQVDEIIAGIEAWFEEGHDGYYLNWFLDRSAPEKVWRKVVELALEAGWSASIRGAMVEVSR